MEIRKRGLDTIKEISSTKELDGIASDPNHPGQEIAQAILERSAAMIAAQISGIVEYHGKDMVFNMLGSLFWKGYRYKETVEEYIHKLSPRYSVSFTMLEDSEIYGTAKLVMIQ